MRWQRLLVCFELLSPVHVGFLPNRAGTVLAPTRCYVPGKNLWGSVTARLTAKLFKHPSASNFRRVGDEVKREVFFSYFFLSDGESIFNPSYTPEGLKWGNLSDKEFRGRFLASHVSTAIGKSTGTAADESLHELEFIQHRVGSPPEPSQKVFLVGAVWFVDGANITGRTLQLREGSLWAGDDADILEEITVGGERNYGFGRLKRVDASGAWMQVGDELWRTAPDEEISLDGDQPLVGHLPYRRDCLFCGDIEILAGREYDPASGAVAFENPGKKVLNCGHYFAPGTRVRTGDIVQRDSWGRLSWKN